MRHLLSVLLLCPLLARADEASTAKRVAAAPPPAADARSLQENDILDLSRRLAHDLRKCKQLRKGAELAPSFRNETEEFLDKEAFEKAILTQLPSSAGGPGRKYDLALKITSRIEQNGADWKGTYVLYAEVKQANEVLCRKNEKLVKTAKVPGR